MKTPEPLLEAHLQQAFQQSDSIMNIVQNEAMAGTPDAASLDHYVMLENSAKQFDMHTSQRQKYLNNYYTRLQSYSDNIHKNEQQFIEKLLIKDR